MDIPDKMDFLVFLEPQEKTDIQEKKVFLVVMELLDLKETAENQELVDSQDQME